MYTIQGGDEMKLFYNKNSKDPIYYAQVGIRNGKKVTTKNVRRFGRHSELLKITDDPLAYVKDEIRKMNEEYRVGKVSFNMSADFNERVSSSGNAASSSTRLNTGYIFLQYFMKDLNLREFFKEITSGRKITFDPYTIHRFLTYARVLDPQSKLATLQTLGNYYEKPSFDYQHILRFMDLLEEHYDGYLTWLYRQSSNAVKRDTFLFCQAPNSSFSRL